MHEKCEHCSSKKAQPQKKPPAKRAVRTKLVAAVDKPIAVKPELLTRREAAAYLGLTEQTLAIWKCTGRYSLPVIKVGRSA